MTSRTAARRQREDIWMVQVRVKGSRTFWSPTSPRWFHTRRETRDYSSAQIYADNFQTYEYRAKRYAPESE